MGAARRALAKVDGGQQVQRLRLRGRSGIGDAIAERAPAGRDRDGDGRRDRQGRAAPRDVSADAFPDARLHDGKPTGNTTTGVVFIDTCDTNTMTGSVFMPTATKH